MIRAITALMLCIITSVCLAGVSDPYPVFTAINNKNLSAVKAAVKADPMWVHQKNRKEEEPVAYAARMKQWDIVEYLLDQHAYVDGDDENENTALHYAVKWDSKDAVKMLLAHKASPAFDNTERETPLHLVSREYKHNGLKIAKMLLDKGADPLQIARHGDSPFSIAITNQNTALVNLFIKTTPDANRHITLGCLLPVAARTDDVKMVKQLMAAGAVVNPVGPSGVTPLGAAAAENKIKTAAYLIEHGADVNLADDQGMTPLHLAACYDKIDAARLLVSQGAKVTAVNRRNETPLHWAAVNGSVELAKLLVDNGADVNARDKDGKTPVTWAGTRYRTATIEMLQEHGGKK